MTLKVGQRTMAAYRQRVLAKAQRSLETFYGGATAMKTLTLAQIAGDQTALRAYPGLDACDMAAVAQHIHTITADSVTASELGKAEGIKLAGEEIVEDAAAGEATRLGLGTKYLLTPQRIVDALTMHNLRNPGDIITVPVSPQDLAPISFGVRHKLQFVFDLMKMATSPQYSTARNPEDVVRSQFTMTVLNEETALAILRETAQHAHFGLTPERTLFVIQEKSLGMNIQDGQLFFDPKSDWKLWNHGDMKAQQTLEGKVFWVRLNSGTGELERVFLKPEEYEEILSGMRNLISYPIEDIDYLGESINLHNLAATLRLGKAGYRMTMESVAQQDPPQKGGFFTFDPVTGRVVCIESDCGGNVVVNSDPASLAAIEFLNKNFNNFPEPADAFRALGLLVKHLHLSVKGDWLYPQTPQGDQNFNLQTAVIGWSPAKTIRNLKQLPHGAPTLLAMHAQDQQPGFLDLARQFGLG